jgi:polyhydroxyalkanoate synthesis regulator phasin
MKEMVKKAFLLGLGAASLTKTAAQKKIKALVKKGAISSKDSREMLRKILAEANKERKRIQEFSKAEVKRIQAKLSKASQPQIKRLKKRISILEKKLREAGKKTAKKALKKAYRRI